MRQHGGMTASTSPETAITIDVDGTGAVLDGVGGIFEVFSS